MGFVVIAKVIAQLGSGWLSGSNFTLSWWSLYPALRADPRIPSGPFLAFVVNIYNVGMKTAYVALTLTTLAYLFLGIAYAGAPNGSWFLAAAGFLPAAWMFNRLFMREQIHKPMLRMEKKVNHDHEQVPDEEVRRLISEWAWYTMGRGLFIAGSFLCGLIGLLLQLSTLLGLDQRRSRRNG